MAAALALAGAVYGGLGLALPLLTDASTKLLISLNFMGAAFAWAITLAWLLPIVEGRLRRQLLEQTSGLRQLSAVEFEHLVGELLRREGWRVEELGRHGAPDGNVDLRVRRGSRVVLVQCKRWESRQVGVDEVRKLGGVLMRENLARGSGALYTSSDFTPTAIAEAKKIGIALIDRHELLARLEAVGATELLNRSADAYLCPECATPMVLDHSPNGWWVRCPRFREGCRGKRDLDKDGRRALELLLSAG
jgi:restriction endonuclease